MTTRVIDMFLIIISGFISFQVAVYTIITTGEFWDGGEPAIYPVVFTLLALLVYGATFKSRNFYHKYRWWIVGILCGLLLLPVALLALGIFI